MTENSIGSQETFHAALRQDGTSQADRAEVALDPDYVKVDERTLKDLLAFARAYSTELQYFNVRNEPVSGGWQGFIANDLDLDEVVAFMQDPEQTAGTNFKRPHFVLFLTFLKLLGHARDQLNTLTRRHLDFYYTEVLRMTKTPAIPDKVNVLIDLAPNVDHFWLKAGTLLKAGKDSLGQELLYATDNDIVVSRAKVTQISTVFADKRHIGIKEAREEHEGTADEAFLLMMQIALGNPLAGDPLPAFEDGQDVDLAFLQSRQQLLIFLSTDLFMSFATLRRLMQFKHRRDNPEAEWDQINAVLENVGKQRTGDPNFELTAAQKDFEANFNAAVGGGPNFDDVSEIDNIYDLYEQRVRRQATVEALITKRLFFPDAESFYYVMQVRGRMAAEWQVINSILQEAGQAKQQLLQPFSFPTDFDPTDFNSNFNMALGPVEFPGAVDSEEISVLLDQYYDKVLAVEAHFFMSAEDFSYLMSAQQNPETDARAWTEVYKILAEAHKRKVYQERRAELQRIREASGFNTMIDFAVGSTALDSGLSAIGILTENVTNEADIAFLQDFEVMTEEQMQNIPVAAWQRLYAIVELAQRAHLEEPVAQKVEWHNLYPASDATAIRTSVGIAEGTSSWATFGLAQSGVRQESTPPKTIGWAISSPMLRLSEGERTITLVLGFESTAFDDEKIAALLAEAEEFPFKLELSTEKGWIEPETLSAKVGDYATLSGVALPEGVTLSAIEFELSLGVNADALTAMADDEAGIRPGEPLLRLSLRQIWRSTGTGTGHFITLYQPFRYLQLERAYLQVAVSGLTPLQLQNDEGDLQPGKPLEPFGIRPAVGSNFHIGHPELIIKRLNSLDFNIEWMGVPDDLAQHYLNYGITSEVSQIDPETGTAINRAVLNSGFTARLRLVDNRLGLVLAEKEDLFAPEGATNPHTISIPDIEAALREGHPKYKYDRAPEARMADDLLAWNRYLRWELNTPDFQHESYPIKAAEKSLELSIALSGNNPPGDDNLGDYHVKPPYTPKLKSLSLGYTASLEVVLKEQMPEPKFDKVFHIHPFGYHAIQVNAGEPKCFFLPQYDNEGELYIGLSDVKAPENISINFQMAEGSADPDLEPVTISWSYLDNNEWISLEEGSLLGDTTRGFINSGIVSISLPKVQPGTLLPTNLCWLRASISHDSRSVCDAIAINTQAVSATFLNRQNAADHLSTPLAAESISQLVDPEPEIAGVRQPFTSYGGKMAERDSTFYRRISERLRHKNRALATWDYEHLILEHFPEIYKVKCLSTSAQEPGQVTVIVIPDMKNKLPFNPFKPKAPADLMADIESFIRSKAPCFSSVHVKNAHYVAVKVRLGVRFCEGYNAGFYKPLLNNELNRFLSPWAYEDGADIVIGGRIYANAIAGFLDSRPYVDYVAQPKLFSSDDGEHFRLALPSEKEGYWVESERPDAVLVAARQHEIDIISDFEYEEENFTGINYMKIELDFIVA